MGLYMDCLSLATEDESNDQEDCEETYWEEIDRIKAEFEAYVQCSG